MNRYKNNFDCFHFTNCSIRSITIDAGNARVEISSGLEIIGNHPLSKGGHISVSNVELLFYGDAIWSKCTYREYVGDPRDGVFKQPYSTETGHRHESSHTLYYIEGILQTPLAWIDCEISAEEDVLILTQQSVISELAPAKSDMDH